MANPLKNLPNQALISQYDNRPFILLYNSTSGGIFLMPSPSAFSKFVLSVLKFLGILKFLRYTQNILGILK